MGCSEEKSVRFAVEDYIRHLQPHIKQIVSGVVPEGAKNGEQSNCDDKPHLQPANRQASLNELLDEGGGRLSAVALVQQAR